MAFQISGRTPTSVPVSPEGAPSAVAEILATTESDKDVPFVPDVFYFVILSNRAKRTISSKIPLLFLGPQAVVCSKHIGDEASFTISRRAIPKGEAKEHETRIGGLIITARNVPQKRTEFSVYKTARIVSPILVNH